MGLPEAESVSLLEAAAYIGGLSVVLTVIGLILWRTKGSSVTDDQDDFARGVRAEYTPEVAAWLRPQMERHQRWTLGGVLVGTYIGHVPNLFFDLDVPWYWLVVALGLASGLTVATLVAGYRPSPAVGTTSRRLVEVQVRQTTDFLSRGEVVELRCAVLLAIAAVASGLLLGRTEGLKELSAWTAILCGLTAVLVVVSLLMARVLMARPMPSSTPEGLIWQRALRERFVVSILRRTTMLSIFSGVVAAYACIAAAIELGITDETTPTWLLPAGCALGVATAAVLASDVYYDRQQAHHRARAVAESEASRC